MSLDLAVTPAPARGKGSGACSVKTEVVRIQELSLGDAGSRSPPKRKQRPPSGTVPTDLTSLAPELPTDKRRGNKRALLQSPVPGDRRRDGEAVEVEGLLVVAEQVDRAQTQQNPPVFRTLGSIYCELVRKQGGLFLETVSKDSHHTIVLDVDAMDLIHEPFKQDRKFQLQYRGSELGGSGNGQRAPSYAFMASTKVERVEWVNAILRCQASAGGKDRDSSPSKPDTGASSTSAQMQQGATDSRCSESDQLDQAGRDEVCLQQAQPSLGEFVYSTPPIKHFILIRHGHYINAHVPQASDAEQVLSQMGRQQAELTGKCLGMAHNRIPTRHDVTIYHSDMTRAVETAGLIANNFGEVSLNASPMLREGWPGTPYSTDFPVGGAAAARNNSAFDAMQERGRMDVERMGKAFNWFFTDSDPANTWGHFEINHCGVTRIDVCANRPLKVIAVNETGHLPQSLITSSEDHL
ncbi:hypothetical protein PF010_g3692 [Phytophthora fragariae]|uniref:Serine/threonine-protein phosphatase PGAM5, mitochondrial n=1 Tax=Phytophthora fragariae TaxID=53985 RepID=A0A6G0LU04_9STRA|nr:hypothetical protein PF010_g3692 [Phytophthora fragariae]KAE9356466.1 hypothetical protein PF008_g3621 [Phytophthora fragariae]